jgi:TRAP-type uncharacterized transport system fused permease subunit
MSTDQTERERLAQDAAAATAEAEMGGPTRQLHGWEGQVFFWGCVAFTAFHLLVLNLYPMEPWLYRSAHVSFGTALGFMMYHIKVGERTPGVPWYDWLLIVLSIACFLFIWRYIDQLLFRAGAAPTTEDVVVGIVGTLLVLEITRRSAGLALPIIAVIFLLYCFVGPWMPGVLFHRGVDPGLLFSYVYSMEGVFGPTTAVSSTYIILFITFAGFLQVSKVGDYFINFAFAIAGRARGGPA